MTKKHEKPEFLVICQNEANAKFYATSYTTGNGSTTTSHDINKMIYNSKDPSTGDANNPSTYDEGTQLW